MNARTALLAIVAATGFTLPSLAEHQNPFAQARFELDRMEQTSYRIQDGYLRNDLNTRINRMEALVNQMEARANQGGDSQGLTFEEAMQRVDTERFDSGKLEVIRRMAARNQFTTREAKALANNCTFEDSKVEALIALYPAVVDKERFWNALDILTFDSSRRRVERALDL